MSKVLELFRSLGSQFVPGAPVNFLEPGFNRGLSQVINDQLNVLSMISCCFFNFVKYCKKTFSIVNL